MRNWLLAASLAWTLPAAAGDFNISNPVPAQADFHAVARDTAAALDYKAVEPSDAGGLLGFAIGSYATYAPTRDSHAWDRLTGDSRDALAVVGVNARKGLPFGIDVGAFYGNVLGTGGHAYGGNLRYALLPGSALFPALALRASYTAGSNLGSLRYHSYGTDVSVSKGVLFLTPYAGLGYVWANVRTDGQYGLGSENIDRVKGFAGMRFALGPLDTTLEYERLGGASVYNLRLAISI